MIYISTACVRSQTIAESVKKLAEQGFQYLELSGGTQPYDGLLQDLLDLKQEFGLHYLCHNYFPPPTEPFVLNLASLDPRVFELSFKHIENALALSRNLGARKFGFHAGFLINIPVKEVGKRIEKQPLFDREQSMQTFCEAFSTLQSKYKDIALYVENNVISEENFNSYGGMNPFFVTDRSGYNEFAAQIKLNLLLDVAHLKVSSQTLKNNFEDEFAHLFHQSDYIHLSDNDGRSDTNQPILENSDLLALLSQQDFNGKTVTLEVYSSIEELIKCHQLIKKVLG